MTDPLFIERNGHRTWLKWHRGRRQLSDTAFTGARIEEAMRLGASVEVDLVVHADHGCVILHDLTLERETTGSGRVRATGADALRQLKLRGNDGRPVSDPVMLLEDLLALLGRHAPLPEALLQLDFKEDLAALTPQLVAGFAAAATPLSGYLILSGGDVDAIGALAASVPMLRTGYDPCHGSSLDRLAARGNYSAFISDALAAAPEAAFIYLDYQVVLAAQNSGFDIVAPIHQAGRMVDAWTIPTADPSFIPLIERLIALKVDQITTDDPEALHQAFTA